MRRFICVLICVLLTSASAEALTRYVWTNSPSPSAPYTNWTMAARSIAPALTAAQFGDTVLATNGTYVLTAQLVVTNQITLRSVNGPQATVIDGNYPAYSIRCIQIATGGKVDGFTIQNGRTASEGAGVYMWDGTLDHCVVRNNHATGDGGGVQTHPGSIVRNCLIHDNLSDLHGGGMDLASGGLAENCTIVSNYSAQVGGGVASISATLRNCIVYYNESALLAGKNYFQGTGSAYQHLCTTPAAAGVSNITAAPLFMDRVAHDYRLKPTSPCLNAGSNRTWMASPATDVRGDPRLNGPRVDIGAVEMSPVHYVAHGGGHVWPYVTWPEAATNISAALSATESGDTIQLSNEVFVVKEPVTLSGWRTIRGDNDAGLAHLSGADATNCLVLNHAQATARDLVIRNGLSSDGGGARIVSGGTLLSCIISSNNATGYGGGVCVVTKGTLRSCLLTDNFADKGGAVSFASNGVLQSCTLTMNEAFHDGGGLYAAGPVTALNCIVYANAARTGTNYWDKGSVQFFNCCTDPYPSGGSNNLVADPLLLSGSFKLATNSPCLNAGTNESWVLTGIDLEGYPRLIGIATDIGAYERSPTHYVAPGGSHVWPFVTWPNAATNLQAAIDCADDYDLISVSNGYYYPPETVVLSKRYTMKSVIGKAATGINGSFTHRCVRMLTNATLDGFTVVNGNITGNGAGIHCGGGGIVRDCTVGSCMASDYGAGVFVNYTGVVERCLIENNLCSSLDGGGVYLAHGGVLKESTVRNNQARFGGGVFCGTGGTVQNCLIERNHATTRDAGIITYQAGAVIRNCTVVSNSAPTGAGGVRLEAGCTLRNSIVYYNRVGNGTSNILYLAGTADHLCTTPSVGTACVTNPPGFRNLPTRDYRLTRGSPCIDSGTNETWMTSAADLTGNYRLYGVNVDRGSYELPIHLVALSGSHEPPFATWATAATNIQDALDECVDEDIVFVTNGSYAAGWTLTFPADVYLASMHGAEQTEIDGENTYRCLTIASDSIVEGFTITRGNADFGAGVLFGATGVLRRCVLTDNHSSLNGGGAYFNGGGLLINSLVYDNDAVDYGGGLHFQGAGDAKYCTVADNQAYYGGGIYLYSGGGIEGSIIASNRATGPTAGRNNWHYFVSGIITQSCTTPAPGTGGNITNKPGFISSGSDYHLRYGSPCIDAVSTGLGFTNDFDGFTRPLDGNWDGTNRADMGCFEYDGYTADSDSDTILDFWERRHSLDPNDPLDADDDDDTDGDINKREWIADTNPHDSNDYFRISQVEETNSFAVTFSCTNSRNYSLQSAASMVDGSWLMVAGQTNIAGHASGTMSLIDASHAARKGFRVLVLIP
ncbi:MAG: hypothetical protein KJ626_03455 [Verrucomicrobia bacterium]|nr:hypothetical protein [Verrucomicrobiota bacterium]